jgi:hypothetical protein
MFGHLPWLFIQVRRGRSRWVASTFKPLQPTAANHDYTAVQAFVERPKIPKKTGQYRCQQRGENVGKCEKHPTKCGPCANLAHQKKRPQQRIAAAAFVTC